jgi:hypothetical protein
VAAFVGTGILAAHGYDRQTQGIFFSVCAVVFWCVRAASRL